MSLGIFALLLFGALLLSAMPYLVVEHHATRRAVDARIADRIAPGTWPPVR